MNKMDVDRLTMETILGNPKYKKRNDALLEKIIVDTRSLTEKHCLPDSCLDKMLSAEFAAFYAEMAFRTGQRFPLKKVVMVRPSGYQKRSPRSINRRDRSSKREVETG